MAPLLATLPVRGLREAQRLKPRIMWFTMLEEVRSSSLQRTTGSSLMLDKLSA